MSPGGSILMKIQCGHLLRDLWIPSRPSQLCYYGSCKKKWQRLKGIHWKHTNFCCTKCCHYCYYIQDPSSLMLFTEIHHFMINTSIQFINTLKLDGNYLLLRQKTETEKKRKKRITSSVKWSSQSKYITTQLLCPYLLPLK